MPLSDDIADVILLQSIELARVEAEAQDEAEAELAALFRTLRRLLVRFDPTEPVLLATRLRRIDQLSEAFDAALTDAYLSLMRSDVDRREMVAPWYARTIAATLPVAATGLLRKGRSVSALETVGAEAQVQGVPAAEWFGRQAGTVKQQVIDRLRRAVLNEQPMATLTAEVAAIEQTAQRSVNTLLQTTLATVAQAALLAVAEANSDGLRALTWLTTLDTRACPICIALSGQSWTVEEKRPLGTSGPWPGSPPVHPRCRCSLSVAPVGEALPRDQAFEPWLRTRAVAEQRAILGPGRYDLWRSGKLKLRQLIDQRHRPLTLDRLQSESVA